MAKIKTMSGIASISGRLGNYRFRTMRSTGAVYMFPVRKKDGVKAKAPSEAMIAQRERFSGVAKLARQMRDGGSKKSWKQLWKIATTAYDAAH